MLMKPLRLAMANLHLSRSLYKTFSAYLCCDTVCVTKHPLEWRETRILLHLLSVSWERLRRLVNARTSYYSINSFPSCPNTNWFILWNRYKISIMNVALIKMNQLEPLIKSLGLWISSLLRSYYLPTPSKMQQVSCRCQTVQKPKVQQVLLLQNHHVCIQCRWFEVLCLVHYWNPQ